MRVIVAVLGDLGRSPRMQYHAEALAQNDVDVDVVGYAGSTPHASLRSHPRITCHWLPPSEHPPRNRARYVLWALARAVTQTFRLVWVFLFAVRKPDVILVQNPPSIPMLLVALVAARLRSARLVVDWHNLGWAVLALRLGPRHPIVALARWWERTLGRRADAHLCVSHALRDELGTRWRFAPVAVLHDRPAERFAPASGAARAEMRSRLFTALGVAGKDAALVVSPTSWTADEDFDLLLDAVERAETLVNGRPFPDVVVLLTGRGPRRDTIERRIGAAGARRFHVRTHWIEPDDYPGALAAADVGISVHRSASGLDLPMKIADMHGAGLPVLALDYAPCLSEMVRDGETALLFKTAETLAQLLVRLFAAYPETPEIDRLKANVLRTRGLTWRVGWEADARPLLFARA